MAQPGLLQPSAAQMEQTLQERQKQKFLEEMKAIAMERLSPNVVADAFKYLKDFDLSWNDDKKGYNPYMEKPVEPTFKSDWLTSDLTGSVIERGSLSSSQIGAISSDKILEAVGELAKISSSDSASTTLGASGGQAVLTSTLSDNQDPNRILLAVFHITAFQTSAAAANIIPYGSSVTPTDYLWHTTHDWNSNNNRKSSGVHFLRNTTAGTKDVVWWMHWRYLGKVAS